MASTYGDFGNNPTKNSYTNQASTANNSMIQLIYDAIDDCIPFFEKTGYLEVCEQAPHLIEIETNPLRYLRYEKFNIWNAARRIVKYWEWKYTLFGKDRALLPLFDIISGAGALNEIEIAIIQSGLISFPLPKDQYGNIIACFHRERAICPEYEVQDVTTKLRILFFSLACCANPRFLAQQQHDDDLDYPDHSAYSVESGSNDNIYDTKVIVINFITSLVNTPSSLSVNLRAFVVEGMTVRFHQLHTVFCPSKLNIMNKYIIPTFLSINTPILEYYNLIFHLCSSNNPKDAMHKLQIRGIPPEYIPIEYGGTWSFCIFYDWLEEMKAQHVNQQPLPRQQQQPKEQQNLPPVVCLNTTICTTSQHDTGSIHPSIVDFPTQAQQQMPEYNHYDGMLPMFQQTNDSNTTQQQVATSLESFDALQKNDDNLVPDLLSERNMTTTTSCRGSEGNLIISASSYYSNQPNASTVGEEQSQMSIVMNSPQKHDAMVTSTNYDQYHPIVSIPLDNSNDDDSYGCYDPIMAEVKGSDIALTFALHKIDNNNPFITTRNDDDENVLCHAILCNPDENNWSREASYCFVTRLSDQSLMPPLFNNVEQSQLSIVKIQNQRDTLTLNQSIHCDHQHRQQQQQEQQEGLLNNRNDIDNFEPMPLQNNNNILVDQMNHNYLWNIPLTKIETPTSVLFVEDQSGSINQMNWIPYSNDDSLRIEQRIQSVVESQTKCEYVPEVSDYWRKKDHHLQLQDQQNEQTCVDIVDSDYQAHFAISASSSVLECNRRPLTVSSSFGPSHDSTKKPEIGGVLEQEDLETLQTGFLMILPENSHGHQVLSYEPIKATKANCPFNSQKRCLFYCLSVLEKNIVTSSVHEQSIHPVTLISFLEEEAIEEEVNKDRTFIDILQSFPNIKIEFVHVFLEPVGLGWYSYQENATKMLQKLWMLPCLEKIEFHTLPSHNPRRKRQDSIEEYGTNIAIVYGFDMSHFPKRLGGSWTIQKFLLGQELPCSRFSAI